MIYLFRPDEGLEQERGVEYQAWKVIVVKSGKDTA